MALEFVYFRYPCFDLQTVLPFESENMSPLTSVPSISTSSKIECIKCKKFITKGNILRHSKGSNCDNPIKVVMEQKGECEVCKS